jgi:fermentation-respiration switch protein FrsA (DUF1100 family)
MVESNNTNSLNSLHGPNCGRWAKELFIIPSAGHVDLYDRVNLIPFDKLTSFFRTHLVD